MKIKLLFSIALALVISGCANGYKEFYKSVPNMTPESIARMRVAQPSTSPIVERLAPQDPTEVTKAYTKRGYTVIGTSMFNSGRSESDELAITQAKAVGADLVLILNPKYAGSVTTTVPITTPTTSTSYSSGTATAYGPAGTVTAYGSGTTTTYGSTTNYVPMTVHRTDYGAVYFVKRRFSLGVSMRDLNDKERQDMQTNKGTVIQQIVDGSPAFEADLLVGDVVKTIDGVAVSSTSNFAQLLNDKAGKTITLSIARRGQIIEKSISLAQ
jgi:membrane-associated protease RseP (regulator of RpoE activity)